MYRALLSISFCAVVALSACSKTTVNPQASPEANQQISQQASPKVTQVSASSTPTYKPTSHEKTYGQCSQDTDCAITKNACGMITTVNQQSLTSYRKKQDRLSQVMRCAKPPAIDMSKVATQCSEGYCRMSGLAEQLVGTPYERP